MAVSVEKLLTDAHTLVIHLKSHDVVADNIIAATQSLYSKVHAMKQYQDDIIDLNEIAKHRPRATMVLGLAQENRQIRELQQENRDLQAALEEHQSALELIMQKYREHTFKLLQSNKADKAIQEQEVINKDSVCQLMDKIDEMAGVMQKAIEVDEKLGRADEERLSCLQVENKALREMLEICTTSKVKILSTEGKRNEESDSEDDKTDSECDCSILVSPDMTKSENDNIDNKYKEEGELFSADSSMADKNLKLPGASKSASDIRKDTVKNAVSGVVLKKDLITAKRSASAEVKKDQKGKITVGKK